MHGPVRNLVRGGSLSSDAPQIAVGQFTLENSIHQDNSIIK